MTWQSIRDEPNRARARARSTRRTAATSIFPEVTKKYFASKVPLLYAIPNQSHEECERVQELLYLRDFL